MVSTLTAVATLTDLAESYSNAAFTAAPACPICAGSSRIVHAAFNIHPDKSFRFDFRICSGCAHGWIDPMPTQGLLNHLYHRGSHSVVGVGWPEYVEPSLTVPEKLVSARELQTESKGQRYLEFGVGKGLLYRRFSEQGWHCHGVDPGKWAQASSGVVGDAGELPDSLSADVIVALDVLEHISDPIDTLRTLRRFAAPGARLYAAMPNRESIRAKIGRQHWRMLRPLGHLNYWSRRSVMLAFASSGFEVGEMRKTDLFEPPIRNLRSAVKATIEHLGLGDQWIVVARPQ